MTADYDADKLDRLSKRFNDQKHMTKTSTAQENQLKEMLKSLLEDYGTPDENGHVWLPGNDYMVKHEARRTVRFNAAKAEEYLRDIGHYLLGSEVVPEHREVTESSFTGYMFENRDDNDPDLDDFFDVTTSWAVKVTEEGQVEY